MRRPPRREDLVDPRLEVRRRRHVVVGPGVEDRARRATMPLRPSPPGRRAPAASTRQRASPRDHALSSMRSARFGCAVAQISMKHRSGRTIGNAVEHGDVVGCAGRAPRGAGRRSPWSTVMPRGRVTWRTRRSNPGKPHHAAAAVLDEVRHRDRHRAPQRAPAASSSPVIRCGAAVEGRAARRHRSRAGAARRPRESPQPSGPPPAARDPRGPRRGPAADDVGRPCPHPLQGV